MNKKTIAKVGVIGVVLLGLTECQIITAPAAIAEEEHAPQTLTLEPHFGMFDQIIHANDYARLDAKILENANPWLDPEQVAQQMDVEDLKKVLRKAGFEGYALRMAQAIIQLESTRRIYAHNQNDATGDNSYGLFQINMFRGLEAQRLEAYNLENNEALFNPLINARVAYKISDGGKNWSAWTTHPEAKKIVGNFSS